MRFMADGMVGRLARWLRIIGNDVEYVRNCPDNDLVNKTLAQKRVLLTSDIQLFRYAISKGAEAFLVGRGSEAEKLARTAGRYKLGLEVNPRKSRCTLCNACIRLIPKDQVENKVPDLTFSVFKRFWECKNPKCKKIYWRGGHWKNIRKHLQEAESILNKDVRN
jgi:uncharacterized protein with PIN domain